ncbi:hypothetical protein FRB96_001266 [Tulasnella sp. 330]|nr:hypothetical protein FRB96_001266 [Tulasnella sp. 330]
MKEEGDKAFESGKYRDAVYSYTKTLDIIGFDEKEGGGGPLRAIVLASRAAALLKIKMPTEALADIIMSLDSQPTSFRALRTHARVRMAQGFHEEAIAIYIRA